MNETVLIVDDSLTVRMDLAEAFEAAAFHAVPCGTLAEAREALSRGEVGVVVLDVLLPDGDGIEFLKEMRGSAHASAAAVLMLSSETEVKDRSRGLQTGADEYVGKPYDTGYVIARARELVRSRGSSIAGPTTVLVIDDSATFREELREALEPAGYAVVTAPSGEEGLRLAADRRPGAIVVDGILPGIDGATVIRHLRLDAALRGVPCLLLTAAEDTGTELRALDAGADAFVRKGEDVSVVLAKLAAILRRATTRLPGAEPSSLLGPKKILAVDDSETYRQEISAALREDGYDVILARSGEEALDLLAVQPVDCILLDVIMPGLGGQETCRRIKSAPVVGDVPLIMLTALENRDAMIQAFGAGADDYISKSSESGVLKARVRAQIRRKQFEDENRRIREELLRRELEATEARAAREMAETRASFLQEVESKNKELEAFSYSVSHDLRAPLRAIDGFGRAVLEEYAKDLPEKGRDDLRRVCAAAQRMRELIDALLELSRLGRAALNRQEVNVSEIATEVADELRKTEPDRNVTFVIQQGLFADADGRLIRIVVENLLGNAWKFTSTRAGSRIEFGGNRTDDGETTYFVRDDGAGFDQAYGEKLFRPFQRLHSEAEFPGTGIGLTTVRRIVERHGGRVWAEGEVGHGATFYFTIRPFRRSHRRTDRFTDCAKEWHQ